jgi:SAM-dependent methyltransferase
VLRFADEQKRRQLGFQWKALCAHPNGRRCKPPPEEVFIRRTGFRPEDLAANLFSTRLRAWGRFAEIARCAGARAWWARSQPGVEVAAKNLSERQANFFQADVFKLPFAPESFDYIYSIGVLHHTPDCEQAFKSLPRLLKPGGRIAIWLYSAYNPWYRMSDVYRKLTRRMKPETLHPLCYVVIPLYGMHRVLKKIPILGKRVSSALAWAFPMSHNPDPEWRVLDTFDWYSPWYQSKHTYEEVFRWFESCGLEDLRVIGEPIAVQGTRPKAGVANVGSRATEVAQCVE